MLEKLPGTVILLFIAVLLLSACKSEQIIQPGKNATILLEKNLNLSRENIEKVLQKEKLNIHDLYTLALAYSEKLAIGAENVAQARQQTMQAWATVLPQVSFRMGLYAPDTAGTTTGNFSTRGFRFYARQTLLTGLDEITGLRAAPLVETYSILQLKTEAALLYDQVSRVFFEYLLLEHSLLTQKILLENSMDLKSELEKRYALGKIRRSEILSIEVMIAKIQSQIISLDTSLNRAQYNIRVLTGITSDKKEFIPETPDHDTTYLKNLDSTEIKTQFLADVGSRPDLQSLKTAWELAKLETQQALGGHLPKVYLEGSYRLPDASSTGNDFYGGIYAEVPLFSGGMVHSKYLAAVSREQQARLRYQEAVRASENELIYYLESWRSGETALEKLDFARQKSEQNYRSLLSDYRLGQATNLEVLTALNDAASVKDDFEKTRLNQMLTIIHLKILTGKLP